jgi:hypothetical protein
MTIDVGYLLSVGFVAEHDEYLDHVKSMGEWTISYLINPTN